MNYDTEADDTAPPVQGELDLGPDMVALQKRYMAVIERHERKRASWLQRAERIEKIYADSETSSSSSDRKFAVLWSNVQTLGPAVYARPPKCVVARRPGAQGNPVVRTAVQGLERAVNIAISDGKLHDAILGARQDRLIAGRGTIWIRYDQEDDGQKVTKQKVCHEFVRAEDFGHNEARNWAEVTCTWRRVYKSQAALEKDYGPDVMTRCGVTLDYVDETGGLEGEKQATVYEIWDKEDKATHWIAKSARAALASGPPPLDLKDFFPHPKPLYGTCSSKNLYPTPDYAYYQDQAQEIVRLTRRIDRLTDSLKLVGFYAKGPSIEGSSELERAFQPGFENKMVPVPSWAAFAEKGGVAQIQYLPVEQVIKVLQACVELRKELLQDIYQITGISDLQRGQTDPGETLGAQQLKAQYGTSRIRDTRDDFIRFAKEACEITAEIVAEHFTEENLAAMSSQDAFATDQMGQPVTDMMGMPQPAEWVQLLRDQFARDVMIDVETDSTIQPDEDAEKQRRVEFMQVMGEALTPLLGLQNIDPAFAKPLIPLFGEGITFVARGFRAGREMEERIETSMQELIAAVEAKAQQMQMQAQMQQQMAQQQQLQGPPPDPKMIDVEKKHEVARELGHRNLDIKEQQAQMMAQAKAMAGANQAPKSVH